MNLQITGVPLPARMTFDKPLTDDELLRFSAGNEMVWIEREADGTLYVKPIGGCQMSLRTGEVNFALSRWSEQDGRGDLYGGSGYLLRDGSMRGAPVSWVLNDRIAALSEEERQGYPRIAPDFVVEVLSVMDDPGYLRRKMDQWIANGVQVAWLIEGDERRVTIFRSGELPEILEAPEVVQGEGVVSGFKLEMCRIWDVEFDHPSRPAEIAED